MTDRPQRGAQTNPFSDTFRMVANTRQQLSTVGDQARQAVKQFYKKPEDLAAFIERKGTPVYVLHGGKLALLALGTLGFEPGFIPPEDTERYTKLTRLLHKLDAKPGCTFEHGMVVVTTDLFTIGFLTHQLHHWLACRSGEAGYGTDDQRLYKAFWQRHEGVVTKELLDLPVEDLIKLRAAINRDMEALSFLQGIVDEVLRPAALAENFKNGHRTSA